MPFKKGHEKSGGRVKGVTNRISDPAREALAKICDTYILDDGELGLSADITKLRPVDRIMMYERLFKYCIPTAAAERPEDEEKDQKFEVIVRHVDTPEASGEPEDDEEKDYSVE